MALTTLQRATWNGEPAKHGDLFRVHKDRCGRQLQAVCELWTHRFGWELRLVVNDGQLQRSEVCRSQDDVLETGDAWKAAMVEKGWA
jgi:hypothetical protein